MMGPSHRLLGALAGAVYATVEGQPPSVVAMTALVATATSNGITSPDADQSDGWRTLTGVLPAWARRHRGLSHWWGLPALAWLLVPYLDPQVHWAAHALIVGWASHLAGDAVFGKVPLAPWGIYAGLGLDTDGALESGVRIFRWRTPSALRLALGAALVYVLLLGTNATDLIPPVLDAYRSAAP